MSELACEDEIGTTPPLLHGIVEYCCGCGDDVLQIGSLSKSIFTFLLGGSLF